MSEEKTEDRLRWIGEGVALPFAISCGFFVIGIVGSLFLGESKALTEHIAIGWLSVKYLSALGVVGGFSVSLFAFGLTMEVFTPKGGHRLLGCVIYLVALGIVLLNTPWE